MRVEDVTPNASKAADPFKNLFTNQTRAIASYCRAEAEGGMEAELRCPIFSP